MPVAYIGSPFDNPCHLVLAVGALLMRTRDDWVQLWEPILVTTVSLTLSLYSVVALGTVVVSLNTSKQWKHHEFPVGYATKNERIGVV